MRTFLFLLAAGLLAASAPAGARGRGEDSTLHIASRHGNYVLSVPVSRLVLRIPQGGLLRQQTPQNDAAHSERYFIFQDSKRGLVVSGWFERSSSYSDFDKMWADEKTSWKSQGLPMPEHEKHVRFRHWQGIAYDIALPNGSGSANIRAFWVEAGTWIDLHVSLAAQGGHAALHRKLMAFLKTLKVTVRR